MIRRATIMVVLGLLALCGSAWAVKCSGPFHGMMSYWKFDEGSGTTAYDSVGDNHGTVYGAVWTTGQVDGALDFDGVDDYVDLDAHIGDFQNLSTGALSVWIKEESTGISGPFFSASDSGDVDSRLTFVKLADGRIIVRISQNGTSKVYWTSTNAVPSGWHHFAYTTSTNPSGNWMYLDGERIFGDYKKGNPSTNAFFNNVTQQDTLRIGMVQSGWVGFYGGTIDDVRIYDRALSAEEIQQLYQIGLSDLIIAINNIEDAIAEKLEMLEKIDATLEKEWAAYEALEELLESGDYGDLKKGDVVTAKQKIYSAIQHEEQSKKALEKSIEKLEDALTALGLEYLVDELVQD